MAHKWTNLDLESEGNRMLLNMFLIGQLALDIRNLFGKKRMVHLSLAFGLALTCSMTVSLTSHFVSAYFEQSLGLAWSWLF